MTVRAAKRERADITIRAAKRERAESVFMAANPAVPGGWGLRFATAIVAISR